LVYGIYDSGAQAQKRFADLGACPLILNVRKVARRDEHFVAYFLAALFALLSARPLSLALKPLKSYFSTGLFAIFIHPTTFYCSSFLLDMSTQFLVLAKIEHNIIARPKRLWYNKPYTITPDFSAMVYFKENGGEKQ